MNNMEDKMKRYLQTEKGKEAHRRANRKYYQSEKGKLMKKEQNKRYYEKMKAKKSTI